MKVSENHFIGGKWIEGFGDAFCSRNPSTGQTAWSGVSATQSDVDAAIAGARDASERWSQTSIDERIVMLNRFGELLRADKSAFARVISEETGKPRWEALAEIDAMAAKVAISIDANAKRRLPTEAEQQGALAATRYKPLGVAAVFGPFNMPGHLPNGHIVPALLAGNCIVFKPSELTPMVGHGLVQKLQEAGFPGGVINLLQGGRGVGEMLAKHAGIDAIFFTGSVPAGMAIRRATVDRPGALLALEMGGNSPLVVWNAHDLDAAAYLTILSAYITAGQRCSCARRLIVADNAAGTALIDKLVLLLKTIRVGPPTLSPEPFMGPVISDASAERLLAAQKSLKAAGGVSLLEMRSIGPTTAMLSPGLIDVTSVKDRGDEEIFGPLLQLIRVADFDAAIAEANRTRFGLAGGLFSDDAELWKTFYRKIRAGVVYWNRQTTGGSSQLPFGGIGLSGNHRPSGYWAADYCSYPVASMEVSRLTMPAVKTPGIG